MIGVGMTFLEASHHFLTSLLYVMHTWTVFYRIHHAHITKAEEGQLWEGEIHLSTFSFNLESMLSSVENSHRIVHDIYAEIRYE